MSVPSPGAGAARESWGAWGLGAVALRPVSAVLPVAVPRASPSGKTPFGQQGPGAGTRRLALRVWTHRGQQEECDTLTAFLEPGPGTAHRRWWLAVGGPSCKWPQSLKACSSPRKCCLLSGSRTQQWAACCCLEVALLGKGRGRVCSTGNFPMQLHFWHSEAGGFCRKLDSSNEKVAAHPTKHSLFGFKVDSFGFRALVHCSLILTS